MIDGIAFRLLQRARPRLAGDRAVQLLLQELQRRRRRGAHLRQRLLGPSGATARSVLWAIPGAQNYLTYSAPSSYIAELESRVGAANAESFGAVTARGTCITGTCYLAQSTAQSAPSASGGPFIDTHAMLGTEVGGGGFSYDESPNIQQFLPVRIARAG